MLDAKDYRTPMRVRVGWFLLGAFTLFLAWAFSGASL